MVKPITPKDVEKAHAKIREIPEFVIEIFNEAIKANWDGEKAVVGNYHIVGKIEARVGDGNVKDHWMDVEDIFRKAGWTVTYHKPGFPSTEEETYTFRKKRPGTTFRDQDWEK